MVPVASRVDVEEAAPVIKGSSLGAFRQKPAQSSHFVVYRYGGAY